MGDQTALAGEELVGKLAYRSEIDGMRAIAVLAVVLFHAGFGFPGGYVGVDVFFVISGFLITGLVMKDIRADRFRFVEFWERRIRRIFPASAVMVIAVLTAAMFLLFPSDTEDLANSAIAQMLLSANFYFFADAGYFQEASELKPLLHTWSLAVEEQFYLLFPWLLVLWKKRSGPQLQWRLFLLASASFAASVWGTYAFPDFTFYMLPTRAWEMMLGAILAVSVSTWKMPHRINESLSWLGLGGILLAMVWYDNSTRFPGANALLPCVGAALLIFTNTAQSTMVGRLLSISPLVMIGKLSYSLYLWHWPVLAIMRCRSEIALTFEQRAVAVALSFLLGWLSWKFVETPLRSPAAMSRKRVYTLSTACSALVVMVSIAIAIGDGFPERCPADVAHVLENGEMARLFRDEEIVPIGAKSQSNQENNFLLWGDSHARAVSEVIHELAVRHNVSGAIAIRSATAPILGTWRYNEGPEGMEWNQEIFNYIKEEQIENVILVARWNAYVDGPIETRLVDEVSGPADNESGGNVFRTGLQRTIRELEKTGARIWLVREVPEQPKDIRRLLANRMMFDIVDEPERLSIKEHRESRIRTNMYLNEVQSDTVRIIDPAPLCFDETGFARIWDDHLPYYSDNHHLSRHGAEQLLTPFFEPIIAGIAQSQEFTGSHVPFSATTPRLSTEPPVSTIR